MYILAENGQFKLSKDFLLHFLGIQRVSELSNKNAWKL